MAEVDTWSGRVATVKGAPKPKRWWALPLGFGAFVGATYLLIKQAEREEKLTKPMR